MGGAGCGTKLGWRAQAIKLQARPAEPVVAPIARTSHYESLSVSGTGYNEAANQAEAPLPTTSCP
jgi:hypothetical protein